MTGAPSSRFNPFRSEPIPGRATIDMFPDDVLLEIFDFYVV